MNREANATERFRVGQTQGWRGEKSAEGDKMGSVSHSRECLAGYIPTEE